MSQRSVPILVSACALSLALQWRARPPAPSSNVAQPAQARGGAEGPWFHGRDRIVGGLAVVPLPAGAIEHEEELGVQLTARAGPALLWVESVDRDRVVVRGDRDVEFDFLFTRAAGAAGKWGLSRVGNAERDRAVRADRVGRD